MVLPSNSMSFSHSRPKCPRATFDKTKGTFNIEFTGSSFVSLFHMLWLWPRPCGVNRQSSAMRKDLTQRDMGGTLAIGGRASRPQGHFLPPSISCPHVEESSTWEFNIGITLFDIHMLATAFSPQPCAEYVSGHRRVHRSA